MTEDRKYGFSVVDYLFLLMLAFCCPLLSCWYEMLLALFALLIMLKKKNENGDAIYLSQDLLHVVLLQ